MKEERQTIAVRIARRLDEALYGSSNPFVGIDDSGARWVVKPDARPQDGPALFSEVVMAGLARAFGLNWPEARIADLQTDVIRGVNRGVAFTWLSGLKRAIPEMPESPRIEDEDVCASIMAGAMEADRWLAQHLVPHFANHNNRDQLAGFAVLSSWAGSVDNKWDALQLDPKNQFFFLDGGHYLGTHIGETVQRLEPASVRGQAVERFTFLETLRGQPFELFCPWLGRLAGLRSVFEDLSSNIPAEWISAD